jgi:hypothetical protein
MVGDNNQDVLVMALFVVTMDGVYTCANDLGIPKEEITGDLIDTVKTEVNQRLSGLREEVKSLVAETIQRETGRKETIECPLGMECTPSCIYRVVGECTLFNKTK